MKKEKNYRLRLFPNFDWNIWVHFVLLLLVIYVTILAIRDYGKTTNEVIFWLAIIFSSSFIISILYSNFLGWNTPFYFNEQKIYRKLHGKTINWDWNELCDIKCDKKFRVAPGFKRFDGTPLRVIFIFSNNKKRCAITLTEEGIDKIIDICPREDIKGRLHDILKRDN